MVDRAAPALLGVARFVSKNVRLIHPYPRPTMPREKAEWARRACRMRSGRAAVSPGHHLRLLASHMRRREGAEDQVARRPAHLRDADAYAGCADRGDLGLARSRRSGVHDADLRPQPGRRVEAGCGEFAASCVNVVSLRAQSNRYSPGWQRITAGKQWVLAEPPVRIELFSAVLVRGSNPVLAAKRQ